MSEVYYYLRNLITSLYNFWLFRKEIYRFRSYDYSFNFNLFIKSLELTKAHIESSRYRDSRSIETIEQFINSYKQLENDELFEILYEELNSGKIDRPELNQLLQQDRTKLMESLKEALSHYQSWWD